MPSEQNKNIAVIGAGVVGLSCALWLQQKGFQVTLIDPDDPGSGTSSGNACTIAEYGCVPINSPDIFKRLPGLLFSKDSPLTLDPLYAMTHPGWMIDFLLNCRRHKVKQIIETLSQLLPRARSGIEPLIDLADAQDLAEARGFMHVYCDDREFNGAWPANQARRDHGVEFTELTAGEIRELEPNLKFPFQRGLMFEGVKQILDPLALCQRYAECFQLNQGKLVRQRVMRVNNQQKNLQLLLDNGEKIDIPRIVVAAGAFSTQIEGLPMQGIKLDAERGYHVQYSDMQQLISRPVSWQQAGFYATPTNRGLRFAGAVEISGYSQQKNPRIINYLTRKSKEMFELPQQPDQEWLGFRPTLPDALPLIGHSAVSENILYAFGHHHLGLTLSGITGKLIAELANGETPGHNIKPFSPSRFL